MILFTANSVTSMHRSRGEQNVSCSSYHVQLFFWEGARISCYVTPKGKVIIICDLPVMKYFSLLYSPCSTEGCVVICIVCYLFVSLLISRTRHGYLRINSLQLLWISCLNGTLLSSKIIVLCVMLCSSLKTARGIHMSRKILN